MNPIRFGTRLLSRSSPVLLFVTGAAAALSFPPVRHGIRSAAVMTTKGVLVVADKVKAIGEKMREKVENVATRSGIEEHSHIDEVKEDLDSLGNNLKSRRRRVAVAATAGVLAISDKAKSLRKDFRDIVDEARASRQQYSKHTRGEQYSNDIQETDTAIESVDATIGYGHMKKKRITAKRMRPSF